MEKSYDEILRLLDFLNVSAEGFVYRGSRAFLADKAAPVQSDAATDMIERAMASSTEEPLYVVAVGAITNVASAILIEPEIIKRIVIVWLGGNPLYWPTHSRIQPYARPSERASGSGLWCAIRLATRTRGCFTSTHDGR